MTGFHDSRYSSLGMVYREPNNWVGATNYLEAANHMMLKCARDCLPIRPRSTDPADSSPVACTAQAP
jgi:hypothetical protein